MTRLPPPTELQAYLDQQRPATLLRLLGADELPAALVPYKAAALIDLDRETEARACLETAIESLGGDERVYAETLQAQLMIGQGQIDAAILTAEQAALAAQAIRRHRSYHLAWMVWLAAELHMWEQARRPHAWPSGSLAARLAGDAGDAAQMAQARLYAALAQAEAAIPDAALIHQYAGRAALLDGDYAQALVSFRRAAELSPQDARTHAAVAEAHYALRDLPGAQAAAQDAIACDPTLPAANVWMARCLAERNDAGAHHYARCAVDQAPGWWLAHLAQAEAQIARGETDAARRSLGIAHALAPARREVRARRGVLLSALGATVEAAAELEDVLAAASSLTPMTAYTARQALCRILFGARLYAEAGAQVEQLLALAPDDPWGLQFQAAACAQAHLAAGRADDAQAIAEVRDRYGPALAANRGELWIARDYVEYLAGLAGLDCAIDAATALRERSPERGLSFAHGRLLARAERAEEAAAAMLDALGRAEGIGTNDDLYDAIGIILDGMGVEEGMAAVMAAPEAGVPRAVRERALGLLLAERPEATEPARALLMSALAANPDDASATLRLAWLAETDAEHEALYRAR